MRAELWSRLARVPVTVTYAMALSVITLTLLMLGSKVRDRVVAAASTNLHNLAHGRFGTLVGSAFVADADHVYVWLPGLICVLLAAELLWRGRRLLTVLIIGHVGATILVAAGLVLAVEVGWLPRSISRVADVGFSYGVLAVVGALTSAVPRRFRSLWFAWWLPAAAGVVVVSADFTDIGHVVALVLGMLISTRLPAPAAWTRVGSVVFRIGACFGYLVLANSPVLFWAATAPAVTGVVTVMFLARRRQAKASAVAVDQSARHDSGG